MIRLIIHLYVYKGLDDRFPKHEKVLVVRDKAPYFYEALGFSLPCLLIHLAMLFTTDLPMNSAQLSHLCTEL